jgi:hypothetical protein
VLFVQYIEDIMISRLSARNIKPVRFTFNDLHSFLSNEFIRRITDDPNFKEFVICRDLEYELIVKLKSGVHHKIGILDGNISEIPEWCGQKIIVSTKMPVIK